MYVEMACGRCEATFSLDSDEEDPFWVLVTRFANAHAECGFMTPMADLPEPPSRRMIMPRLVGEPGEA